MIAAYDEALLQGGQGELPKGQEKVLWGMTSSRRCKTEQFVKNGGLRSARPTVYMVTNLK